MEKAPSTTHDKAYRTRIDELTSVIFKDELIVILDSPKKETVDNSQK